MIQHTIVDGVETLVAPMSGPAHAGITFRVGHADETLARRGITHLIEHLALHHLGMADYHFNGVTGPVTTQFHLRGSESDVASFVTGVCDALSNLPLDRLDIEKGILNTEASSRSRSVTSPLSLWRYGAATHGLFSYPEWGLNMFSPDDVREWVARYFTRENAVLWIAGDRIPDGLRLRLPGGVRQPVPAATSALPQTPAFFSGSAAAVAYEAVVVRRTAASMFSGVLERELFRALRQETGLSYTTATNYEPRGDGYASVVAVADALPDKQDAVLGGFVDVLAKLRLGRIDQADLDAVVAKNSDLFTQADVDGARLSTAAYNQLVGYPNRTIEEIEAETRAVTLADVWEVAREASGSALLMTPEGHNALWAGFAAAPVESIDVVTGTRYSSRENRDTHLIIGPEGVSLKSSDGQATVRYRECAAMLSWPDGGRLLIGRDSISVRMEPTLFEIGPQEIHTVDAAVPHSSRVFLEVRDPESIPKARPVPRKPVRPAPRPSVGENIGAVVLGLAALSFLCLSGVFVIALSTTSEEEIPGMTGTGIAIWIISILLAVPSFFLIRRRIRWWRAGSGAGA